MRTRVVITGLGVVTPLGKTIGEFLDLLMEGKSAIGPLEGWEIADKRFTYGGQIKQFNIAQEMPAVNAKRMLRYTQFSLVAAQRAIIDADLPVARMDRSRIGTSFGTAAGSLGEAVQTEAKQFLLRGERAISPAAWMELTPSACTTHVAVHFELCGPCATISSGCVTSLDTMTWGIQQIRAGKADVMIVGGTDTPFYPFMWGIMCRSGSLSPAPQDGGNIPRPFSFDHQGLVLMEGGGAIVIESEAHALLRHARIYGEVTGVANRNSGQSLSKLDPTGQIFADTMLEALRDAGQPVTAVDWVCAHGTGHVIGDSAESSGIEMALGQHAFAIPVSSIRGAIGQPFASGGVMQVAAACAAIQRQRVPPTINFTRPAEGCRLDYVPNVSRVARIRRVMINTAAIGGIHSAIMVERYDKRLLG